VFSLHDASSLLTPHSFQNSVGSANEAVRILSNALAQKSKL
jgi:hypothetical protein